MSDVMDHVAYLSKEIGPRPAGTEEEQQAALYITEHMQKEAGLPAVIEDFTGVADSEIPRAICSAATVVFTILALALPVVALPAALIAIISAAVYVAEALDKPVISRLLSRGVSQNVVAKYEPGYSPESGNSRRRKVILIAHYDSGKAHPELNGPVLMALPIVKWVVLGAFALDAILLFLGATAFADVSGAADVVLTAIIVILTILSALPLIQFILHKASTYNDGANCNASGVAVMMEAAARVGRGRTDMSAASSSDPEVVIHGEDAAREEGLIPEGASVSYQAKQSEPVDENASPVERLVAAKAAIAALSGKPVSDFISEDIIKAAAQQEREAKMTAEKGHGVVETLTPDEIQSVAQQPEPQAKTEQQPGAVQPAEQQAIPVVASPQPAPAPVEEQHSSNLPDWFITAQKKAKRSKADDKPVARSRYADALEAAVSESSMFFEEANNAVLSSARQRMQARGDMIVEIPAPASAWQQAHPDAGEQQPVDQRATQADFESQVVQSQTPQESDQVAAASQDQSTPQQTAAQTAFQPMPSDPGMTPILPADMALPDMEPLNEVKLPSFLTEQPNPQTPAEPRTENRVTVDGGVDEGTVAMAPVPMEEIIPENASAPVDQAAPIEVAPVFVEAVTSATGSVPPVDETVAQANRGVILPPVDNEPHPTVEVETLKQRAPLADRVTGKEGAKGLLNKLPDIDPAHPDAAVHHNPSAANLRAALPSLSGALPRSEEGSSTVSLTGSFAPVGATSAFAPVGDELLEDVDPDDIYVDDADDSDYQESYTESGAFAGPGYVEMPKSRVRRLFDHFHRKKKKEEESTPQQWLNVDESFEARQVGAARGSWESFREEQGDLPQDEQPRQSGAYAETYEDPIDDAFDDYDEFDDYGYDDSDGKEGGRPWYGGAFSRIRMGRVDMRSGKEDEPPLEGDDPVVQQPEAPEMQKIYQFRNPDINTEVWFVALGADLAGHSGMRAFIEEHSQELRGSIIIELEALGAGTFSIIDSEGGYRVAKTSSRMRRYTRKASQATGLSIGSASMLWKSSASSYAINHGLQAMHLAGMDGSKPASFGAREDTETGVDGKLLHQRVDFIMELLKNI